ncbi:opsin-3 isoform X1 [Chiloscyllium plagiosum]|uniref:opsin-3 isoform X1 n=1 Tax=Chiloscyllium plagiosum TaxID=36176 RepID=UPI001CB81778|nr:opsin-3 isoform X1 [Chiloscyllium plagiosum]
MMNLVNSTAAREEILFSPSTYKVLAASVGTIGVLGVCNNLLMLLLYCKFKRLKTPTNLLLVNISISDLLLSVFGVVFTFVSCVRGRWVWDSAACVWDGFSKSLFGISSIMSLAVLAYERYIRVVNAKAIDFSWVWRAITYIWLYSLAWSGAPLVGWNKYSLELHKLGCSVNWDSRNPSDTSYVLLLFLGCLLVPVGVIAYCYGNILYSIRMLRNIQDLQSVRLAKIVTYEKNMAKMCFFMITIFLFCWVPYAMLSFMLVYGYASKITPTVTIILSLLAKSSTAYNHIIYLFMSRKYRWCLMQLLCSRLMRIKWIIKDHAVRVRGEKPGKPIVLSEKVAERPKKRVTFSSSSIIFIITSDETWDMDSAADDNSTNPNVIQVRPLKSERA